MQETKTGEHHVAEVLAEIERERLDELLLSASRTFAINIPMLPGLLRDSLTLGYLLLRNADTIEDAYVWPKERRLALLEELNHVIQELDPAAASEFVKHFDDEKQLENQEHLELLRLTPYLLEQVLLLPPHYVSALQSHVGRVIVRMQTWVAHHDEHNRLRIARLKELDDYCYAVAGIVGELITTLISLYRPSLEKARLLLIRTLETACGAGLQLTNIIKDVFRDHQEGRYYIPPEFLPFGNSGSTEGMKPIIAHAYRNLCMGKEYACALPEEEVDIRKAVLTPLLLAVATLKHLQEHLESLFQGEEVKISRETVYQILSMVEQIAGENQAICQAWDELSGSLLSFNSSLPLAEIPT
jgi:farnesyl-diphosphate farnesyltransferase